MQRLLEQKSPYLKHTASSHRMHIPLVLLCIGLAAYIALFLLPYAATDDPPHRQPQLVTVLPQSEIVASSSGSSGSAKEPFDASTALRSGEVPSLHPWGYNKDRNLARWKPLYASIAADQRNRFTLIDYGSDQGFFSVSVAKFFPQSLVMGLEMGGCGGEIWKKHCDVLLIQERQLRERQLSNMIICQTKMHQDHFRDLAAKAIISDYQFVLSVFHWFNLRTREDFEAALVDLLRNAKTTFIELPTIGDDGPIIRKQVNYESFKRWYDGRTNVGTIIAESATRHQLVVNVTLLVSLPWAEKYTRDVYRVDQLGMGARSAPIDRSAFRCEDRRKIYGCNTARTLYNACPST
jgi:hypothetical protein